MKIMNERCEIFQPFHFYSLIFEFLALKVVAKSNLIKKATISVVAQFDIYLMMFQNPNEDTEWNDILRSKGIIAQKEKEVTEEDIVNLIESTVTDKTTGLFIF